jgi:hypothetical protein
MTITIKTKAEMRVRQVESGKLKAEMKKIFNWAGVDWSLHNKEIARQLGCTVPSVYMKRKLVKMYGVEALSKPRRPRQVVAEPIDFTALAEMWSRTGTPDTTVEIARECVERAMAEAARNTAQPGFIGMGRVWIEKGRLWLPALDFDLYEKLKAES